MQRPSKESTKAWLSVGIIGALIVGLSLFAGQCNSPSNVVAPFCTNEAYAHGTC